MHVCLSCCCLKLSCRTVRSAAVAGLRLVAACCLTVLHIEYRELKKSLLLFLVRPFSSPKTLLGPLTVNCPLRCFSDFCSSVARLFSFKVIVGRRLFLLLQYSPGRRVVSRHRVSYLKSFIAQGVAPSLSHYREMCAGQLISSLSSALLACRTMTSIPVGFFLVLA